MSEIENIDKRIEKEVLLKSYKGVDRVVHAEDKRKEIEETNQNKPPFRAMSGIKSLDDCTDGFRKGQLIVVSGPTKNGKTSFCQTLTNNFIEDEKKCIWFSYELGYEELFDKFPEGTLDFYVPNYIQDGNLEWVEDRIIESKQKFGTEIVFLDHLDFLRDPVILRGVSLNMSAYIGGIVQKIKSIAVRHGLVIFLMSHIRKNKWTSNELPSAEELRDSGQIAQLSDMVLMLIRKRADRDAEEVYLGNSAVLGVMENRHNGKTKKIGLKLVDNRFEELTLSELEHEREHENDSIWDKGNKF